MRLALIGGHGHHYVRQILKIPNSPIDSPIAFASDGFDAEQAKKVADSMDGPTIWFADVGEMYESFIPELVSIGSIYAHNGDLAADALERGVPTISDKPIATSAAQLLRLQQIASKPNCPPLITEYDFRARRDFVAAKAATLAGEIGEVVLISVQKSYRFGARPSWYADREQYGGLLMWVLSHAIDFIPFATGSNFKRITGHAGNRSQPSFGSMEDHIAIIGELENGATAIAHGDFARPAKAPTHGDDRLRIVGSKGLIEIVDGRCTITTHDAPPRVLVEGATKEGVGQALFDAAMSGDKSTFSTRASLESARLMLSAREAVDQSQWLSFEASKSAF